MALIASTHAQLQLGFYANNCPKAEQIVLKFVHDHIHNASSLPTALIRMHFHDCFVRVRASIFKLLSFLLNKYNVIVRLRLRS